MNATETIHATCVARGDDAVLLIGGSGAGKSDLALRLIDRGWTLVSDDYTLVTAVDGGAVASAPAPIAGRIEVRGVGIVALPHRSDIRVVLLLDLDGVVERLPESRNGTVAGISVPCFALAGLEPSAALKVERILQAMTTR